MAQSMFFGVCSAYSIKLSSSIDDIVWFAPFLTRNSSWSLLLQNSLIYLGVCSIQTVVAMAISYWSQEIANALGGGKKGAWSTERMLTVGAGSLLGLYALKLIYDEIFTNDEDKAAAGGNEEEQPNTFSYSVLQEVGQDNERNEEPEKNQRSSDMSRTSSLWELHEFVVDAAGFGKDSAKTAEDLENELTGGRSKFITSSGGQVQREVDLVTLRLLNNSSGSEMLLLQVGEESSNGRKREKPQLPGTKQGWDHSVEQCVWRIAAKVDLTAVKVDFNFDKPAVEHTELESVSYPGMVTVYHKSIVSGYVKTSESTSEGLARIGLPACQAFSTLEQKSKRRFFYKWFPVDKADNMIKDAEQAARDQAQARAYKQKLERQMTLFVISFVGSIDDLSLFVPMLAGKGFNDVELFVGSFFATITILLLCFFLGQCQAVADCLMKVPLAAIVGVFASVLLFKGLYLAE